MRRMMLLLLSLILGLPLLSEAQQHCWRLLDGAGNPLIDLIRVSADGSVTHPMIFKIHGGDEAGSLYHASGAGSATNDTENPSLYRMTLNLHHTSGFFNGNRVGAMTALLIANVPDTDPTYLSGTWSMQFAGGPGAPFNVSGLIDYLDCPAFGIATAEIQEAIRPQTIDAFGLERAAGRGNFVGLPED